jgi:hypothetical protein
LKAVVAQFRDCNVPERSRRCGTRSGHRPQQRAGNEGQSAQKASTAAGHAVDDVEQVLDDPGLKDELRHQHEQRDGGQRVARRPQKRLRSGQSPQNAESLEQKQTTQSGRQQHRMDVQTGQEQ